MTTTDTERATGSQLRTFVSYAAFPTLVAGAAGLALWGSGTDLGAGWGLDRAATDGLVYVGVIALAWIALVLLEWLVPYRSDWRRSHGDVRTDVVHLIVSAVGTSELAKVFLGGTAVVAAAWLSERGAPSLWPSQWPWLAQLLLALAVAELGHYVFHRISHESAWVWRLHAAHHSAPRLYWLNATRFHPADLFCLIVFQLAPLILLGINPRAMLVYGVFTAVYGQIQHCNADLRTGTLSLVFSTPQVHRWHHSPDPSEGNANYGAVLNVWDQLFGTFFLPRDREFHGRVGIGDMRAFPSGYLGQLVAPVRWAQVARSDEERARTTNAAPARD
jgi:sterol desaturase/sphingolipid hydroxylase (fatty acid hydroxylase superfamily)